MRMTTVRTMTRDFFPASYDHTLGTRGFLTCGLRKQVIDRFQSRGQQLCKLLGIKESFNM